jgi:hypothetical protein
MCNPALLNKKSQGKIPSNSYMIILLERGSNDAKKGNLDYLKARVMLEKAVSA